MKKVHKKRTRIGVIGCGAIGSRIAKSVKDGLSPMCVLSGLYDIDTAKSQQLAKDLSSLSMVKNSYADLLRSSDFIVEAVSAKSTKSIVRRALEAKKDILVLSVGKLLNAAELFKLSEKNKCSLLIPSGGIGGLDAIKAASLAGISNITLTTRKPISGFTQFAYFDKKGIELSKISKETVLFEGDVATAVKLFPKNINVAATLSLASQEREKIRIVILTAPHFKTNSHEITAEGSFGRITCKTENLPCYDNPKTSYLAVLSGIRTLKDFFNNVKFGT